MSAIASHNQLSSSSSISVEEKPKTVIRMSRRGYPKLVIPCGRARSGKDTCAEYLQAVWGYKVNHFAGALKRGCKHFFKLTDDQLYGDTRLIILQEH
jgi:hypothetical protein